MVQFNSPEERATICTIDRMNITTDSVTPEQLLLMNFHMCISRCILEQRKKLDMTQEDLARLSGVSRITISAIEKRKRMASTEILLKLLDALGLVLSISER